MTSALVRTRSTRVTTKPYDDRRAGRATGSQTLALVAVVMMAFAGMAAGTFVAITAGRLMGKVLPRRFRPSQDVDSTSEF